MKKGNVRTLNAFDNTGFKETTHLMKILRDQGFRIPKSLRGIPTQFILDELVEESMTNTN